jgi:phosphotransferase system enzyme I (PtsI)
MASQPLMVFALIGLGVRQLSVSPRAVPIVKRLLRNVTASAARDAVTAALSSAGTAREVELVLRRRLRVALGEG